MRASIKSLKEFDTKLEWHNYITRYMQNTVKVDADSEIRVLTGRGETIAVWCKDGHGYIEECRSPERLNRMYY